MVQRKEFILEELKTRSFVFIRQVILLDIDLSRPLRYYALVVKINQKPCAYVRMTSFVIRKSLLIIQMQLIC